MNGIHEVSGSIPLGSTTENTSKIKYFWWPKDEVAVMYADQAGWHAANELRIADNVILRPLPAYSPELNPVERIWLHLKERCLSHRLHDDYEAIVDAACVAWNKLTAEAGRSVSAP